MTLRQYFGLTEFPWTTVLACAAIGLIVGLAIKVVFWGSTPGGMFVGIRLGIYGLIAGGFLGLATTSSVASAVLPYHRAESYILKACRASHHRIDSPVHQPGCHRRR